MSVKKGNNSSELDHVEYSKPVAIIPNIPSNHLETYLQFASKDQEWLSYHTKHLLRKVDLRLLPLLVLMYLLNFLDRNNLAQARLGGLEADLGMKGTDFNLATSILFIVR